jgi:hypothetical protein
MHSRAFATIAAIGALSGVVRSQFPPTPEGITVLQSHVEDGVEISYKEVITCFILSFNSHPNFQFKTT